MERAHQTLWIAGARKLQTYLGRDMDRQAAKTVHKITRKELKLYGRSRVLMNWPDFIAFAEALIHKYNNKPHSALPKVTDADTGRRRHMTPQEMWDRFVAEGWEPVRLTPAEAADLSRPHEERVVKRGTVSILGYTYKAPELEHWHDNIVHVAFDIADSSRVWVKDTDGRLICEAPLEQAIDVVPLTGKESSSAMTVRDFNACLMDMGITRGRMDHISDRAGNALHRTHGL